MATRKLKPKRALGLLVIALAIVAWQQLGPGSQAPTTAQPGTTEGSGEATVRRAFRERRSDIQLEVEGRVVFLFPPDRDGRPHQRFLLELPAGHTLKIAHNLTLSTRIPLAKGDVVRVYGEYEYNDKGGVVHWTHKDPRRRHPGGWIQHKGLRYD